MSTASLRLLDARLMDAKPRSRQVLIPKSLMVEAVKTGDVEALSKILDAENGDANTSWTEDGTHDFTLLMGACRYDHYAVVELLLSRCRPASVDLRDSTGQTALMWAVFSGNADIVRLLLQARALTEVRDHAGRSALDMAGSQLTANQYARGECGDIIQKHVQAMRALELDRRREKATQRSREAAQRTKESASEAAAREQKQQERARQQAVDAARQAAEFEEQRQAIAAEAAAKIAAQRKKVEERQAVQRERDAVVEDAARAEQKAALLARKTAEAEAAREQEALHRKRAAEDEAKERARRQALSEAKKVAKQAKKESKKKQSPFALQEEQERQAAEERCAEEVKAAELAAALAAEQRERHETERRHAEARLAIEEVQKAAATQQLEEDDDEEKAAPASVLGTTQGNQSSLLADADDETLCIYCLERKRAFLFVPCGHRCLCHVCSGMQWEQCPVCRRPKESLIEVFG